MGIMLICALAIIIKEKDKEDTLKPRNQYRIVRVCGAGIRLAPDLQTFNSACKSQQGRKAIMFEQVF